MCCVPGLLGQGFTVKNRGQGRGRYGRRFEGTGDIQIAGLIVNTCTSYLCPGLSSYIAEDLGLKTSIRFLELMGMGCGAAIPNLEAAAGMLARSGEGPVLSHAVEICSATIFPSHEPELVVSNFIFADGAAAAVLDLSREGHHGGLAQKELNLAGEALRFSYNVFENYGNMSSPSVLFVLREILDSGRPQPGQKGMLLAFGAGFSAFAALMEFASA